MVFTKDWFKTHSHPRGMSGKKHTEDSRRKMAAIDRDTSNLVFYTKGHKPWNDGKEGVFKHTDEAKLRISLTHKGERNGLWKGDDITYRSLHSWVQRNLGKANKCEDCGGMQRVEWASISHNARRDLKDYKALCATCHGIYDTGFKKRRKK